MSIPESVKTKNGELKRILKKAVRGIIPKEIIERKKQGFNVPIREWFFERLGGFAEKKITNFTERTDYLDKSYVKGLFGAHKNQKLWYLLNFVLWHEKWIENINIDKI